MIALGLLFLFLPLPQNTKDDNRCTLCHPDVRVKFEQSVHRAEEVTCVACHGGDATATKAEDAHKGNYKGVPKRNEIPALCASCHADVQRMRPFNLSTDQFALYQTSVHGQKLAAGDTKVAVCIDCHGAHRILRRDNPESSVFPRNIPKTCGRCHSDPKLMSGYGKKEDPQADFAGSVHGRALEQGNHSAPDCARCHSAHGATPPGVGDIDKVCGQCHVQSRRYFVQGPHKKGMEKAGLPECASCHHNHRTRAADINALDKSCETCHPKGSPPLQLVGRMKTLYDTARDDLERARSTVKEAAAIPLNVEDYLARLEEAKTSLLEVMPMMHALDVKLIESLTSRARAIGDEVESEVAEKLHARKWRQVGLGLFWFYLLLTIAILMGFRARAARQVTPS